MNPSLMPWWLDDDVGNAVVRLGDRLWQQDSGRRARALACAQLIEPPSVDAVEQALGETIDSVRLYLTRNACETLDADICGRQRVRVVFLTDGAVYSTRRRALRQARVVEAVLSQPQPGYSAGYDLLQRCHWDALSTWGSGALRVNCLKDGVELERIIPHHLLVDRRDAARGTPSTWVHRRPVDRYELAETYPEKRDAILSASAPSITRDADWCESSTWTQGEDYRVSVCEAWLTGPGGRHVVALADGTVLLDEEWDSPRPPIAVCHWSRSVRGFWGTPITALTYGVETQHDDVWRRLLEGVKLRAGVKIGAKQGSVELRDIASNDALSIYEYTGDVPPSVLATPSLDQGEYQVVTMLGQAALRNFGVSEQLATAQRAPGVSSAEGQRTVRDLGTQRNANHTRDWESFHVDVARVVLDGIRRVAEDNPKLVISWPGKTYLRQIDWRDADLAEDQYHMVASAASELSRELSARLAETGELYAGGLITADTYKRLLAMPDLEAESDRSSAEYDYLEGILERFADAELTGDNAEDPGDVFVSPDGYFTNVDARLVQVGEAYFACMRDGAPQENLDLFRRYIRALQAMGDRQAAVRAAAQAPAAPPAGAPQPQLPPGAGIA